MSDSRIQLVLSFRSVDFEEWRRAFDSHREVRVRHGALGHQISRSVVDPHRFLVVVPFASHGGAVGYSRDPNRRGLQRAVFGASAMRNHGWEESIHELIDADAYGYAAKDFGTPGRRRTPTTSSSLRRRRMTPSAARRLDAIARAGTRVVRMCLCAALWRTEREAKPR